MMTKAVRIHGKMDLDVYKRQLAAFDRRSLGHRSGFPLPVIVLGAIIRQARAFVKRIFRSMRRKCDFPLANFTNFCYNITAMEGNT